MAANKTPKSPLTPFEKFLAEIREAGGAYKTMASCKGPQDTGVERMDVLSIRNDENKHKGLFIIQHFKSGGFAIYKEMQGDIPVLVNELIITKREG